MSKRTKIVIAILVIAVAAYLLYNHFKKKNAKPTVVKANITDPRSPSTTVVSNLFNGLEPDEVEVYVSGMTSGSTVKPAADGPSIVYAPTAPDPTGSRG